MQLDKMNELLQQKEINGKSFNGGIILDEVILFGPLQFWFIYYFNN